MMRISWTEHMTNNSILEELEPACRFLAEVKRENYSKLTSAMWLELITSARTFTWHRCRKKTPRKTTETLD